MSSEIISLRDSEQNKKIPSYSITRNWTFDENEQIFGQNIGRDTISKDYWENCRQVKEYLERLEEFGTLDKTIQHQDLFERLIKKLHLIQTSGILRQKDYDGQSNIVSLSDGWKSEYRSERSNVHAFFPADELPVLMELIYRVDFASLQSTKNNRKSVARLTTTHSLKQVSSTVDLYVPPTLLPKSALNQTTLIGSLNEAFGKHIPFKERNSIYVLYFDEVLTTGVQKNDTEPHICGYLLYPSAQFIPSYIEGVRRFLVNFDNEEDSEKKLARLANAYQMGIRSQAFETVWNSEMMGIVNFYLTKKLGLKPVAHGRLDYCAFFVSKEAFEIEFKKFVRMFN